MGSVSLIDLAREDAELLQYRRQITALPHRIDALEKEKSQVQKSIQDAATIFEKNQKAIRKIELEIEELQAKRAKSESRQASLTSTTAYQALIREMEQQERRISQLEDELLESMERTEKAGKKHDQSKSRFEDEIRRLEVLQAQLREDLEAAKRSVKNQETRRNAAVDGIDQAARVIYERVLKGKGDIAIALVRDDSCGACNMRQTPQILQLLRQSKGIQTCQSCGRILVMDSNAPSRE